MTPTCPGDFAFPVLDALPHHIAVIDLAGAIIWTNRTWRIFGAANGARESETCEPVNYLEVCRRADRDGEVEASQALSRIRAVIEGKKPSAYFEYACHSPEERRWFALRCAPIGKPPGLFVITHADITERKLAELQVGHLAMVDGLTGIANRRRFDGFIDTEWRRARRNECPITLVMLDVDRFKQFNDSYGHLAGDDCLRQIATVLAPLARRPGDLFARYGGEEFAMVLGATGLAGAAVVAEKARQMVADLAIPHDAGPGHVTISAGVATFRISSRTTATPRELQKAADECLYRAKREGRNRVCTDPPMEVALQRARRTGAVGQGGGRPCGDAALRDARRQPMRDAGGRPQIADLRLPARSSFSHEKPPSGSGSRPK